MSLPHRRSSIMRRNPMSFASVPPNRCGNPDAYQTTGDRKIKANWRLRPSAKAKRLSARWLLHLACEVFSGHTRCVAPKSASISSLWCEVSWLELEPPACQRNLAMMTHKDIFDFRPRPGRVRDRGGRGSDSRSFVAQ